MTAENEDSILFMSSLPATIGKDRLVLQKLTAFGYFHIVLTLSVLVERTDLVNKLFVHLSFAIQKP